MKEELHRKKQGLGEVSWKSSWTCQTVKEGTATTAALMSGSLETRCGTWCFDPVKNQLSSERSSLHGNGGSNQLPGPGQGLGGV